MRNIPETHLDLLGSETRAYLFLATLMPDGTPQVTPVWFDHDDTHILVNSARGRVKDRNMRTRPAVALVIQDPDDPYRYLQVRGRVESFTEEGGLEHIDRLARKYTGNPWRINPGEVRVTYRILPEHCDAH